MPELAEVQAVVDDLQSLVGQQLQAFPVHQQGWPQAGDPSWLRGAQLQAVTRWGKRIRVDFKRGSQRPLAVISLGMTGNLLLRDPGQHVLWRWQLTGAELYYRDPRRFGSCLLFADEQGAQDELASRIGPDGGGPWSPEQLQERLGASRAPIKAVLLDQARISGLGNYLCDEMLGAAGIHPARPARSLSSEEWERLNQTREQVVERALAARGLSFDAYRHVDGSEGDMLPQLRFYGRAGQGCLVCSTRLIKGEVAGRGTVWCPHCQPQTGCGDGTPAARDDAR